MLDGRIAALVAALICDNRQACASVTTISPSQRSSTTIVASIATTLRSVGVRTEEIERTVEFAESLPEGSAVAVMLQQVASAIGHGVDVSFLGSDKELTRNQAADLLNDSRPHLLKIMERGLLDYHMVGTNRRFAMADLLDDVKRHERANAHVNRLLDTRAHARDDVRDNAAKLTDADIADLDSLVVAASPIRDDLDPATSLAPLLVSSRCARSIQAAQNDVEGTRFA